MTKKGKKKMGEKNMQEKKIGERNRQVLKAQ